MQEYDHRHFSFQRMTGLPRGYFDEPSAVPNFIIGAAAVLACVVFIVLAAIRVFA